VRGDISCFELPKGGSKPTEFEDACYVEAVSVGDGEVDTPEVRIAIADGASEGLFAGRWAGELVRRFVGVERDTFADTLREVVLDWERSVAEYIADRTASGVPVQWYEEQGLERGAFATLLVLCLSTLDHDPARGVWSALALGDTCVFHVRDEEVVTAFPVSLSTEFGSRPRLLPSRPRDVDRVTSWLEVYEGDWRAEDTFYLATDALSAWFLGEIEAGGRPWETLRDLGTADAPLGFAEWVEAMRAEGAMRNDDVTLIRMTIW
jgi:hypothetical protein